MNRLDFGMSLPDAIAAPRATQRNTPATPAEAAFINAPTGAQLAALGHTSTTSTGIGIAAGLEFGPRGLVTAVGEPTRRGGTSAAVRWPARR